ncbi:MAG: TraB/GumN family protein [Kofleriaceae bacterium]
MRLALVVVVALLGCRDDSRKAPRANPEGSAKPTVEAKQHDPWAEPAKTGSVADLACPTVSAPYFFRVEKDGKTSYLLGTRHIGVAWRKMPKVVHEAMENAKLVVFETVDDDGTDDTPAPTKPARDALGPELWARYRQLAGDALADSVENDSPATAMLMLMVMYEDRFAALEEEITIHAQRLDKPMKGLETSAFQQKLLDKYLDARAMRAFVENVDSLDEIKQDTIEDLTEYCGGTDETPGVDPKERAEMKKSGYTDAEIDTMNKEMLSDRNRAWIPKLETMFEEGDVFVAVGADHTRGADGVPALLEGRGYRVVRVTKPK